MIRALNIKKSFGNNLVLKGISSTFESGKCNLIIGRSGAGKTVLLKILVGLLLPDEGEIWFDEINALNLNKSDTRKLRSKMGMLFQGSALFDSMSVEENIRFPLDMFTTMTYKEKRARVDECLERVDLANKNKLYPSELSGGMQKRVGIARAIVLKPQYLFCDEPNSGLDPKTSIVIDKLIQEITKEYNIVTIINTHDMNSVMEIGDTINFIDGGNLAWHGIKEDVLDSDSEELQKFIFASPFLQKLKARAEK